MTEMIKVVAENHQTVGRTFPGWRYRYPELACIAGQSCGASAVVAEVSPCDLDALKRDFQRAGLQLAACRSLSAARKSSVREVLDAWERVREEARRKLLEKENPKILAKLVAEWKKLYKRLDSSAREQWKSFQPEQALKKELENSLNELKEYLAAKKELSRAWKKLYGKMNARTKELFKGFNHKSAGLEELDEKIKRGKETLEEKVKDKARELDECLEEGKEALEERLEEAEDALKEKFGF